VPYIEAVSEDEESSDEADEIDTEYSTIQKTIDAELRQYIGEYF
jgi:hypothetical protein